MTDNILKSISEYNDLSSSVNRFKDIIKHNGGLDIDNFMVMTSVISTEEWDEIDQRLLTSVPTSTYNTRVLEILDKVVPSKEDFYTDLHSTIIDKVKEEKSNVLSNVRYILERYIGDIKPKLSALNYSSVSLDYGPKTVVYSAGSNIIPVGEDSRAKLGAVHRPYCALTPFFVPYGEGGYKYAIKNISVVEHDDTYINTINTFMSQLSVGYIDYNELYDVYVGNKQTAIPVFYAEIINSYIDGWAVKAFEDILYNYPDPEEDTWYNTDVANDLIKKLVVLNVLFNENGKTTTTILANNIYNLVSILE